MMPRESFLSASAFLRAGFDFEEHRSESNSDTIQAKLSREAALLASLPETARSGFAKRVASATESWDTALEIAGGVAVGVGLALAHRNPSVMWGLAGKISAAAPRALGALASVDIAARAGEPVLDVWNDRSSLESSKTILGDRMGALAFEYGAMLGAGGAAARLTSKVNLSSFGWRSGSLSDMRSASLLSERSAVLAAAESVPKIGVGNLNPKRCTTDGVTGITTAIQSMS